MKEFLDGISCILAVIGLPCFLGAVPFGLEYKLGENIVAGIFVGGIVCMLASGVIEGVARDMKEKPAPEPQQEYIPYEEPPPPPPEPTRMDQAKEIAQKAKDDLDVVSGAIDDPEVQKKFKEMLRTRMLAELGEMFFAGHEDLFK